MTRKEETYLLLGIFLGWFVWLLTFLIAHLIRVS